MNKSENGFSLVELSICLVIIGILCASVVAGQALVKRADMLGLMSEHKKLEMAFTSFEEQYGALPGDMTDATSYWPGTANGNGDRLLLQDPEEQLVWQHLALAGMIPGRFDGVLEKFPSKYHNNYWRAHTHMRYMYDIPDRSTNSLQLTTDNSWGTNITPSEGQEIDRKIDDGYATTGEVRAFNGINENNDCVLDNKGTGHPVPQDYNGKDADYNIASSTSNDQTCLMYFKL